MKPAVLLLLLSSAALAQDGGLQGCRTIADNAKRLACYDALAVPIVAPPAPSAVGTAAAGVPTAAPVDRVQQAAEFGLENQAYKKALDGIEGRIKGFFDGWEEGSRIELTNGQVWQVTDDSRGFVNADSPKVRITRAALGSFFMEFETTSKAPRVRRLR